MEGAKALQQLAGPKYVKFFVDSQAAILTLDARQITSKLVHNTINELNKAGVGKVITICWTKAHVGTEGNERADMGAKKGSELALIQETNLPKAELKSKITDYFYGIWESDWASYGKARMSKLFYTKPNSNQAKYVLKLGRLELSRYIKLITGHNALFYFKNKIDPQINAVCRFCLEEDESFYHLLTECPVHRQSRVDIFLDKLPDTDKNWSVRNILDFSNSPGIREAIDGDTSLRLYGEDHNWTARTRVNEWANRGQTEWIVI